MAGNLERMNKACPALAWYALGTELNKVYADLAALVGRANKRNCVIDTSPGLAIGAGDLTIKITNTFYYTINGVIYKKAATDNIALPGAGYTCAASKYAAYLITINAGGTVGLAKGADAASEAAALAAVANVTIPDDVAVIGMIHIQNDTTEFIPGATATGKGDFADDTTADTYVNFIGFNPIGTLGAEYTQTFAVIT